MSFRNFSHSNEGEIRHVVKQTHLNHDFKFNFWILMFLFFEQITDCDCLIKNRMYVKT